MYIILMKQIVLGDHVSKGTGVLMLRAPKLDIIQLVWFSCLSNMVWSSVSQCFPFLKATKEDSKV